MNDENNFFDKPLLHREYYLFSQNSESSIQQILFIFTFLQKVKNSIATKLGVNVINTCVYFWEKMVHYTIQWINCVVHFFKYENKLKIGWET